MTEEDRTAGSGIQPPPSDDLLGRTLGHYKIIRELGRGGMATVYLAQQVNMNRQVAIKILPREFLHDPQFIQRFAREVETIARLEHPHILPVYDYGEADRIPYIVMRYLPGGTLRDWQHNQGKLTLESLVRPLDQVCSALDFAHAEGIIHRDLKPSNIMLDDRHNAYLSDFGIAQIMEDAGQLTGSRVIGTPAYMSPEQAEGRPLDGRSDLYAMGVVLFELLTGREPYQADTPMAMLLKQISEPMPSPRAYREDITDLVERVVFKTTAKDPSQRYAAAGDMAKAYADAVRGVMQGHSTESAASPLERTYVPGADVSPLVAPTSPSASAATGAQHDAGFAPTMTPAQGVTPSPTAASTPAGATQQQAATAGIPGVAAPPAPRRRGGLLIGLAVVAALVIVGAVVLLASGVLNPAAAPVNTPAPSATSGPTNTPAPTATPAPPTPFSEANVYRGPNDVMQLTVPRGWRQEEDTAPRLWTSLWAAPARNAMVAVQLIRPEDETAIDDFPAMTQQYVEANYSDARFYTPIDNAEEPDGGIRYSYRIPQPDGLYARFGRGQLDVFFYQRGPLFLRLEIFIADEADQSQMLPLLENVLRSVYVNPNANWG